MGKEKTKVKSSHRIKNNTKDDIEPKVSSCESAVEISETERLEEKSKRKAALFSTKWLYLRDHNIEIVSYCYEKKRKIESPANVSSIDFSVKRQGKNLTDTESSSGGQGHQLLKSARSLPDDTELKDKNLLQKKKKKKKKKSSECTEEEKPPSSKEMAADYLKQWKENKDQWKFQKVRQTWLLQHMYDQAMLSDTDFKILLEYLEPMKGKAKEETLQNAVKIVDETDDNSENTTKVQRAREIVQLLN